MEAGVFHVHLAADEDGEEVGVNVLFVAHGVHDSHDAGEGHFDGAVGAVGCGDAFKAVGDAEDAGGDGHLLAAEFVGVSGAVDVFVVAAGVFHEAAEVEGPRDGLQQADGDCDMLLHDFALLGVEGAALDGEVAHVAGVEDALADGVGFVAFAVEGGDAAVGDFAQALFGLLVHRDGVAVDSGEEVNVVLPSAGLLVLAVVDEVFHSGGADFLLEVFVVAGEFPRAEALAEEGDAVEDGEEFCGLVQDVGGGDDFSDIVEQGGEAEFAALLVGHGEVGEGSFGFALHGFGEHHGEFGDALAVSGGVGGFFVDGDDDHSDEGGEEVLGLADEEGVVEGDADLGGEEGEEFHARLCDFGVGVDELQDADDFVLLRDEGEGGHCAGCVVVFAVELPHIGEVKAGFGFHIADDDDFAVGEASGGDGAGCAAGDGEFDEALCDEGVEVRDDAFKVERLVDEDDGFEGFGLVVVDVEGSAFGVDGAAEDGHDLGEELGERAPAGKGLPDADEFAELLAGGFGGLGGGGHRGAEGLAGLGFALGAEFFADAGGASAEFAEVVEFGAADIAVADDFDLLHHGGAGLEGSLHRLAGGGAADDEGFVDAASASGDDDAFKELGAAGGAFGNADADGDGVAGGERGEGFAESGGFLALQFFYYMHGSFKGVGGKLDYIKIFRLQHNFFWVFFDDSFIVVLKRSLGTTEK